MIMINLYCIQTKTIKVDKHINHYKDQPKVVKIDNHHLE
jgi:hypothetical protein